MKYSKPSITLCLFILMALSVTAQQQYSTVKIIPPADKYERAQLLGLLEIDHFDMADGFIIAEINQQQLLRLSQTTYRYEVAVADVAKHNEQVNRQYYSASPAGRVAMEQPGGEISEMIITPAAFQVQPTLGGFYNFVQMNTAMNNLVSAYPSLVQKTSLGLSTEGRNIWCIKISDNVATDETTEPEVLFIGLQHAREAIGGSSMIFFMQYLCENYATDSRIQALVNNREIFIIPCMNPDGWEYNRSTDPNGGGGWRKNRRNNGDGTFGVDLNRNWGVDWANCAGASSSCGSSATSSDVYWGPAVFSEPETQAVKNFVIAHHIVSCIDQHSFGPYYSLPFGRPALHPGPDSLLQIDQDYYECIPAMMGRYNGMRAGNSIQSVGYEVAGGVKDWMLKGDIGTGTKGKVWGMTGEGGAGGGTGGSFGSFWPPVSEIINLCKGIVFQNLQMVFAAGSYFDINDESDIAVNALSGSFNFSIKRTGLLDAPVTVTMLPLENIQSVGAPVTVNSMPVYAAVYNGSISYTLPPAMQAGYRIKFAWKVETGGQTYYDTIVKFYNPVQLFYDNMEGASATANWFISANWGYTGSASYAGTQSLTESPGGLYGANRNDIIRCNTVFNLSDATAAFLSYRVKHRAENFRDKLQTQISVNGTTWAAIAGNTTVQEPGTLDGSTLNGQPALTGIREDWVQETFDLSAYLGQPAVQLRLVFTSDANTTGYDFQVDDGFNIDNLKLIKSTVPLITLPVEFISFTGKIKNSNAIQLDWKLSADSDAEYFMVEKSGNGISFVEAGQTGRQQFSFIDVNPFAGNNYYRIKAAERTGSYKLSNTINVPFKPSFFTIVTYPNPAADEVHVQFRQAYTTNMYVRVTDATGRLMYKRDISAVSSGSELIISSGNWASGIYVITLANDKSEIFFRHKIVK